MWDKKRPETAPGQTAARPEPQPIASATPSQPVQQVRPPEPVSKGTAIGKAVTIVGDIISQEDLFIDGDVKGNVDVRNSRCTVGPNGKAKSNVRAREVIIQGQVQGDVEATQKITIRKEGSLVGNIKTTGIIIEDDAYFKGSIDIVRNTGGASSPASSIGANSGSAPANTAAATNTPAKESERIAS
jgi:cytoskeletal protein CcmA (bactofilin family)